MQHIKADPQYFTQERHAHHHPNSIEHRADYLCALEARRHFLSTVIKQQAQGNGHVQVDPQDVRFNGGAKADSGLEIGQALQEAAAGSFGWSSNHSVHKAIQQVRTHPQLQGVSGACRLGLWPGGGRGFGPAPTGTCWGWWAGHIVVRGAHQSEKEEVEGDQQSCCSNRPGNHLK